MVQWTKSFKIILVHLNPHYAKHNSDDSTIHGSTQAVIFLRRINDGMAITHMLWRDDQQDSWSKQVKRPPHPNPPYLHEKEGRDIKL